MILPNNIHIFVLLAMQYLNVPYIWGGQDFTKLDCSGLVVQILKETKLINKKTDLTAQNIYDKFITHKKSSVLGGIFHGSLLFFGKDVNHITHVGIALDQEYMINAAGGDKTVTTLKKAIVKDARVKITKIRNDLVGTIFLDI